jgi:hypothetical protein
MVTYEERIRKEIIEKELNPEKNNQEAKRRMQHAYFSGKINKNGI